MFWGAGVGHIVLGAVQFGFRVLGLASQGVTCFFFFDFQLRGLGFCGFGCRACDLEFGG